MSSKRYWFVFAVVGALLALTFLAAGGQSDPPGLQRATAAKEAHINALLATTGVVGAGVGLGRNGQPAVVIFTESANVVVPGQLDGVQTSVRVTGKIYAAHCNKGHVRKYGDNCDTHDDGGVSPTPTPEPPGGGETDPKARFTRPIPIGVSVGPAENISVGGQTYCITGTYGRPLLIAGVTHLLSNAHVLAREGSTPATAVDIGPGGDKILQPGPADTGCVIDTANDTVGTLAAYVAFKGDGTDTRWTPQSLPPRPAASAMRPRRTATGE